MDFNAAISCKCSIRLFLARSLELQEHFTLIEELLCCHALDAQAINSRLPGLQRPPADGCLLGSRCQIVAMLAQDAPGNIEHKALCSSMQAESRAEDNALCQGLQRLLV